MASSWIEVFCNRIAATTLPNVFNPYASCCPIHDLPDAPEIRRRNLSRILNYHASKPAPSIWFGRDLGYRGGRRTGLALTDEVMMIAGYKRLGQTPLEKATRGPVLVERTASVIWELIGRLDELPILWNAFPLHPHEPDRPMTNRTHTKLEREVTAWSIEELKTRFPDAKLIAIGNDASKALRDLGYIHETARHPSYGGQRDFVVKMESLHELSPVLSSPIQTGLFG